MKIHGPGMLFSLTGSRRRLMIQFRISAIPHTDFNLFRVFSEFGVLGGRVVTTKYTETSERHSAKNKHPTLGRFNTDPG